MKMLAARGAAQSYTLRATGVLPIRQQASDESFARFAQRQGAATSQSSGQVLGIYVDDCGGFGDFLFGAVVDGGGQGFAEGAAVRGFQHELETVVAAGTGGGGGGGGEGLLSLFFERREAGGQGAGPADSVFDFAVADEDGGERSEWRIVQEAAEVRFFFVEGYVILLRGELDRVVLGIIRFDK